jgi:hypothetical protein
MKAELHKFFSRCKAAVLRNTSGLRKYILLLNFVSSGEIKYIAYTHILYINRVLWYEYETCGLYIFLLLLLLVGWE